MPLTIETFVLGPLETDTYLLRDDDAAVVVDPGFGVGALLARLRTLNLTPQAVWLTHGHGDHIGGLNEMRQAFDDIEIVCPEADAPMLTDADLNLSGVIGFDLTTPPADRLIAPGDVLTVGRTQWQVLDTSGHTPGGVSYYCPEANVVLTGDALFAGSIGRTDIPRGSSSRLLNNIIRHLATLPDDTRVLPGHGPESTMGFEKAENPFITSWKDLTGNV